MDYTENYTKTIWRNKMNFTNNYINLVKSLNKGSDIVIYNMDNRNPNDNFMITKNQVYKKHVEQTKEDCIELKNKYENNYFYTNVLITFLFDKLKGCIDPTDDKLYNTDQYIHSWQVFNGMLLNNETDEDLFVLAFIHDLGKILISGGEKPENVVCANKILEFNGNLNNSIQNFNHDEYCYNRLKPYLSEKMLFCIKYHSQSDMFTNNIIENEKQENIDFLYNFFEYDQNTKGEYIPECMNDPNKVKYVNDLLIKYFPNNIDF